MQAPDSGPALSCRPTSSKHPYRPFAAAEAAAGRHRVASTAARLLRGYYEATTRATATRRLQGYYEAASYQATTRLLPGYYQATLPGHYQATTRLLPGYYQESRARHLASSTAAAAQPYLSISYLSWGRRAKRRTGTRRVLKTGCWVARVLGWGVHL